MRYATRVLLIFVAALSILFGMPAGAVQGNDSLGGIEGTKWEDKNGDGDWDEGEPVLPGVTIYVDLNKNDEFDEGEPSAVTSENGTYSINGLPSGEGLFVYEVVPEGYEQTWPPFPSRHGVNLDPGSVESGLDFGNQYVLGGIEGTKWEDKNGDGDWDEGEPVLPGVTIYVDLNENDEFDEGEPSAVTSENGTYSINGLPSGEDLFVYEVVPEGYEQTWPPFPFRYGVNLGPGSVESGLDFGNRKGEIIVQIDIKPGSDPNSINPNSNGVIPVAILTTGDFDATTVDPDTVLFGPGGAAPVHCVFVGVDNGGDTDMLLHFRTQETGIEAGDTEATLTGKTIDGTDIIGIDSVRTVPPEGKGKGNKSGDSNPGKGKGRGKGNGGGQGNGNGDSSPGNGGGQGNGDGGSSPGNSNGQGNGNGDSSPGNGGGQGNGNSDSNPGKGKGKGKGE